MNDSVFIPVVLGTAREGRKSEAVARFVAGELGKRPGVRTRLVDVADFLFERTIPDDGQHPKASAWRSLASEADGFLIVAPEYNHSFPGELKQLLDCAYSEYEHKPVAVCGVSDGMWGGARMIESLRPVLITLALVPIRASVYFPRVDELIEGDTLRAGSNQKSLDGLFDELLWYARSLARARSSVNTHA